MSVIEAVLESNPNAAAGDMAAIADVKRILGNSADELILAAVISRTVYVHTYDRPFTMSADQRKTDLFEADGRFFNCITIR